LYSQNDQPETSFLHIPIHSRPFQKKSSSLLARTDRHRTSSMPSHVHGASFADVSSERRRSSRKGQKDVALHDAPSAIVTACSSVLQLCCHDGQTRALHLLRRTAPTCAFTMHSFHACACFLVLALHQQAQQRQRHHIRHLAPLASNFVVKTLPPSQQSNQAPFQPSFSQSITRPFFQQHRFSIALKLPHWPSTNNPLLYTAAAVASAVL